MLTELRISNFALIDHLHLEFPPGFLVLTGETGAGKSLLVDALALLVGGRASTDLIRSETEEANLEAVFSIPSSSLLANQLRERDLLQSGEHELIIRRVLSRTGKNRIYLNGSIASLQGVQELANSLVDIHSQHDQQSLLSSKAQLDVLDGFGNARVLRNRYGTAYDDWKKKELELKEALTKQAEQKGRQEFIEFQLQELNKANLQAGEEEMLAQEYQRLKHAGRVGELIEKSYQYLYEGDQAVLGNLQAISRAIQELSTIDSSIEQWTQFGESASVSLQELADRIRDYRQNLHYDPERLAEIDDRMAQIQGLKRKYQSTYDELLERTQVLQREVDGFSTSHEKIEELRQEHTDARLLLEELGKELSSTRQHAAKELEKKIKGEFKALRMEQVRTEVRIDSNSHAEPSGPTGNDSVEFLLSSNPGEPLQPLAKIVSGGELSRIMLAIKSVLADADEVPILIFDEVDSGIGGAVAAVVGERLRNLAKYHQVFCITHLPQVASQASSHYLIEKKVLKDRTVTDVRILNEKQRQDEVARMLGGLEITEATRQTAGEMLQTSSRKKKRSE